MKSDPDGERIGKILTTGLAIKKEMIADRETRRTIECPFCKRGAMIFALVGRRNHLRMACDTCDAQMME